MDISILAHLTPKQQTLVSVENRSIRFFRICLCLFAILAWTSKSSAQTITNAPATPTWNAAASDPLMKPGISVATLGIIAPTSPFIPTPPYLGALEGDQVIKMYDTRNIGYPTPPATGRTTATPDEHHHHNWDLGSMGNVYGIAIDNNRNTYVTASTHYGAGYFTGAGTVGFGGIGDGQTADTAALDNNTQVLNSTTAAGAIYKIDAITGNVSLLASLPQLASAFTHENCENAAETQARNTGPALGNVEYDAIHDQLFVSNFEDGKIYRLSMAGAVLSTFDPFLPDNGVAGLPPDPSPYGLTLSADGSTLYFGTLDFANPLDPGLYAVNLTPAGEFTGSEIDQDANLSSDLNYAQTVGGGFTFNPWTSYSDLKFSPRGELMVGVRTGCGATAPNLATSHNHGGTFYKLVQDGSGLFNAGAPGTVGPDGNFPIHYIGDVLGPDDGYGGVGIYDKGDGTYDYMVTSGDIGVEEGPHGFLVFPHNYDVGDNVSTYFIAQGSAIPGLVSTNPPNPNSDYKGVFGDIEVLGAFLDWGDAPDSYNTDFIPPDPTDPTDLAGPAHIITGENITIGTTVDFEKSGIPGVDADGDDSTGVTPNDEDGVTGTPSFVAGAALEFNIPVNNPVGNPAVTLYAWLDLDMDGTFGGVGEFVSSAAIPAGTSPTINLNFGVGPNVDATTYLRLRITSDTLTATDFEGYASNGEVEDHQVAFQSLVSIGNLVWMDNGAGAGGVSNDGIKQSGEIGVPGVVVQLFAQGQATNTTPVQSTATLGDGSYIFNDVPSGSYFVHIPASEFNAGEPLEDKVSSTGQGAADNIIDDNVSEDGDDVVADGISSPDYVLSGDNEPTGEAGFAGLSVSTQDDNNTNNTVDFGFYQPVSIGNLVWMDNGAGGGVSNDGILNGTEAGVPGVIVQLFAQGQATNTMPIDTTVTAADGSYILTAPPGQYFVHIPASEFAAAEPLEDKVSTTGQGAVDNTDDDNLGEDGDDIEADGISTGVYDLQPDLEPSGEAGFVGTTVSPTDDNNTNSTADFGFYQPVSIGNLVWMDNGAGSGTPNDGILNGTEVGIPGVIVQLFAQGQATNTIPVDSTTTAADGSYILTAPPGQYFVHIPAGEFAATEPLEGKVSSFGQGAADNTDDDNIAEDGDDFEVDGVSSGIYDLQPNLEPAGEAGFVGTTVSPTDDNNTNSSADFAFYQPVAIGNLIWMDNGAGGGVSNDGILNGAEIGVPGVVVQLFAQGQATNTTPVDSTTTAADGSYILTAPTGQYFVHIPASEFAATEPLEDKVSTTGQGSADNTDDDNVGEDGDDVESDGVSSGVYDLQLNLEPSGEAGFVGTTTSPTNDNNTNSTADFGFYQPVSIGNLVWMDNGVGGGVSNDGILNGTEAGIPGVVVQLFAQGQATNTTPVDSTTTAADGSYILTAPPGQYFVHIPAGEFGAGEPLEEKVSTMGQGAADNTDDDNIAEDGDDVVTDGVSSGIYDLQPNLEPTGEAGFVGTTISPTDDNNTNTTVDFGFYAPVSIGNLVWMDNGAGGGISNDGIVNGTEAGVPGVIVQLFAQGQATNTAPVDSTTTAADGSYVINNIVPGSYFVHIPASEFAAAEPLQDKVSTTGQGAADNVDDDDVAEDGDDNEVDGVSSGVYSLLGDNEPAGESGFSGTTLSLSDDNNTNSTADFGFYQPVSIGNLVWMDNGAGGGTSDDGIVNGTEAGVPGVVVQLFAQGQATNTAPVDSTTTAADGSYILTAPPGAYFVHIPASEFAAAEPLEDKVSTTGQGTADNTDDDNLGEDGDDVEADGVSSGVYDLQPNLEPSGEAGFVGSTVSPSDDDNTNSTADFGFYQQVSVGNLVWMDNGAGGGVSNDGILNGTEAGVPGVVVQLFAQGQATNTTPVDTTTTAADGSYVLTAPPGAYFVHIPASEFAATEPLEDKVSTTGQGAADNTDDDNVNEDGDDTEADGVSSGVYDLRPNLEPSSEPGFVGTTGSPSDDNNTNSTADFGFYQPVSIGNLVWMDNGAGGGTSNDGILNGTEAGVPGVIVQLFAQGQATNTTPVDSSVTAADGSYILTGPPGQYFVHIPASEFAATEPLEDKISTTGQGAADNVDDDNVGEDGDDLEADGVSSGIYDLQPNLEPSSEAGFVGSTVSPSDDNNTNTTADFGFYQPVSIGNLVWMDNGIGGGVPNDGIINGGEVGVPGVVVQLFAQGQATNTTPVDATTTAADGSYILTASPGQYFVHIPAGEFGAGEPLEEKVSTTGQGAADNTDDDNIAEDGDDVETDGVSSGLYDLQPNLEPTGEAGFVGTTVSPSDDNNTNSTVDFGFYAPVSIGNLVWMDNGAGGGVSNDGIVNGTEAGVPGVVVQLFAQGQATNTAPVDSTTTAADGSYVINNIVPGSYFIHIPASEFAATEPLQDKVSTTGQGAADNVDDDNVGEDGDDVETDGVSSGVYALLGNDEPTGEAGFTGTATSTSDDNNTNGTADFGFYQPVSIGNLVWMDNGVGGGVSNDGILNGSEAGVPGVIVQLFAQGQATNTTPVDSTTTAADGSYILTAPPGAYFVHIPASEFAATEPLEAKVSTTGQGTADNTDDDNVAEDGDDIEADGVSSGTYDLQPNLEPSGEAGFVGSTVSPSDDNNTNSTADFGFYQPVSIGNLVWMDNGVGGGISDDGIVNGTEAGVPGVIVQLFAQGQATNTTPVDTTTTAADGSYILTAPPGAYFVHIPASEFAATEPLEDKISTTGQGAADNVDDDNVGEDGDDLEADGVSSGVYDLQPNLEPSGEAGFVGTTVSPTDDNNTNSTADFGFYQLVSIGNLVWMDNGVGGGVSNDGILNGSEAGVPGVIVQLFAQGQATNTTPVDSTTTAADGSYILTASPGQYFVHIPASEFAVTEPLEDKVSTTGQGAADNVDDDNIGEDGDDIEADGVSSGIYDLQPNLEPSGEAGFVGTTVSPTDDNNTNSTADFGFYQPVSIGNLVWMDNGVGGGVSNDGILNGTEAGVAGVIVQLFAQGQATNTTPVDSSVTAADGSYILTGPPGQYFVHIPASEFAATEPLEDKVSTTGQGAADNADDDNVGEDGDDLEADGVSSGIYDLQPNLEPTGEAGFIGTTVSPSDDNNTNSTADFGFYQPISVGNVVWMDNGIGGGVANDGIINGTEAGVSDVLVQLFAQGQATNTTPVDSTTTAADGSYILTGPPGQYFIHIPASEFVTGEPLAEKVSTTGQGTADNADDDNVGEDGDDNEADGVSSAVYDLQPNLEPTAEAGFTGTTVSPSDDNNTNSTVDFGFYAPVSLGNLVWMDNGAGGGVSNDGIINGTEVGVPDVVVQLFAQGQLTSTPPVASTATLADGSYVFNDLVPGSYFVHIPASEFATAEPLQDKVSTTGQGVADNSDDDNVGEDGDDTEADGVSTGVYALLGDAEPTGEAGFAGLAVSASDDNNTNSTADFGFYQPVSVGNLVWMDNGAGTGGISNDGILNGTEVGVPGVVVQLFAEGQATNTTPVDSTTTAADGSYILTAPPGRYFVHVPTSEFAASEPLEDKVSTTGQGAADNEDDDNAGEDGDDNEADGVSTGIYDLQANSEPVGEAGFVGTTVSPSDDNNTNSTADLGFYQPVSVGNLVWMDNGIGGGVSNDGILNGGESGVPDVVVQLFAQGQATNTTPVDSTTTAADGSYILTAPPGQYFVHIPASEFAASEPLEDKVSTTGQGLDDNSNDDNAGEDGDDTEVDGVSSGIYDLQPNLEPTGEAGFVGVTLSPSDDNNTNSTADFGFYQPVSIGNLVWMDNGAGGGIPNDGILNGGESGVSGVVVQLFKQGQATNTAPVDSTLTAADGSYILTAPPGTYFVHIPASEFAVTEPLEDKVSTFGQGIADNTDDDNVGEDGDDVEADGVSSGIYDLQPNLEPTGEVGFAGTTVSPSDDNNTNSTADFGFLVPASIGSFVWKDLNGDGIQSSDEPPITVAEVELLLGSGAAATDLSGAIVASVNTASDGLYVFSNLPPASYKLQVKAPPGLFATSIQTVADDDDTENDSNVAGMVAAGVFESGVFTLVAGAEPQESDSFRGDDQDSSLAGSPADLSGNMTIDFGFVDGAAIGNYVWLDFDIDGVQDANEDGIANVTVNLFEDTDGNGVIDGTELTTVVDTSVTGPNGEYLFQNLMPGKVYITQVDDSTLPASFTQTFDEGSAPSTSGVLDHTSDPITLLPNEEHLTADFGYVPPLGSIGDTVWVDVNDNGVHDPGEPGLPGVEVTLTPPPNVDPDGPAGPLNPGDPVIVLTDVNGKYLFANLPLGNAYVVAVTANVPPQYSQSPSGLGDPDVRDGNSDPSEADESTIVVLLSSQPINLDADFGYLPTSTVNNSIGDTIWKDLDEDGNGPAGAGDGSDANEPPIAGVTVTLINSAGDSIATVITDADGKYLFTGLPDDDYTVLVTDGNNVLGGLVQTVDSDDPANPGSFVAVTPNQSVVLGLAGGVADLDQDFGYVNPSNTGTTGAIGDLIFFDEDRSGTADIGEGLEGVTVQLFAPGPDGDISTSSDNVLIGSTVTDENGSYLFTGISIADTGASPGTDYQVVVVDSSLPNGGAGWVNNIDPDSAAVPPGDNTSVVTLSTATQVDLDQDFGYVSEANNQISGTVWSDSDGDGMQTEDGRFEGVTIELLDENGNLIQMVLTNANGDYQFMNLPDGVYTVVVTDEDNVLGGYEHTDSPNGTSDVSDETSKDDTGYTVDLDSAGISPTPVIDITGDFGYEPTVTNPISLGSFLASSIEAGTVQISWATQTEVSNIGFNLYALVNDEWQQLNNSVILSLGDSVAVQTYSATYTTEAGAFALGDIDLTGKETLHGPFRLGQQHGVIGERKAIDWQAERALREARKNERERLRIEQQRLRNQQRKLRMLRTPQSMYNSRPIKQDQEGHMIKQWFDAALIGALGLFAPAVQAADLDAEDIVNLQTTEAGIYQLQHEELLAYGIDLSGEATSRIALMNRGNAVQINVTGSNSDPDAFGPGAKIQFIAQPLDTLYSDTNVYTLRLDHDMASRMALDSRPVPAGGVALAYLSKTRFAPQKKYSFTSPVEDDPWYASRLVAVNSEVSEDIPIILDDFAAGGNSGSTKARLSVSVWGATDLPGNNDHHVRLSFNGVQVADSHFDGLVEKRFISELDSVDGINQVTVALPMDTGKAFDAINLNEIEVHYPRKFRAIDNRLDFTSTFPKFRIPGFTASSLQNGTSDLLVIRDDIHGQTVMTGADVACNSRHCRVQLGGTGILGHYYLSSTDSLRSPTLAALPVEQDISSQQAAYLIISHPDFIGPGANNLLETLATELALELGSAQVVDVDSIYAKYGHHLFDPQAIQTFIKESVQQRGTRYVLLVGGDVYDYRQFSGQESQSFIPSIYASTGNHINFAPVDAKFVDLDNDNVPDLPIGRLPVRTVAQLQSMMAKRNSYLNRNYSGQALFVADQIDTAQEYDFSNDANQIESQYLSQFSVSKAYVDELGVSQARSKVIQKINQGQSLTSFFGHSSTNQWAFNGLFTGPDAANLTNVGRPTVVTQWGCWNTYYVSPKEDSMGHRFMMEGDQGAVSVMGASTLTNANSERKLAVLVFERIADGERLGDAITGAKQEYAQQYPNDVDVLLGWTLLGLPELRVN